MGLGGCHKTPFENTLSPEYPAGFPEEKPCQIRVCIDTPAAKVAAADVDESRIASLQVLVFRENGFLENYGSASGSSLSIDCTSGPKTFWAFANTASLSGIRNLDELNAFTFSLNTVSPDALPMRGCRQALISTHSELNIEVSRMVCKIELKDVVTRMAAAWSDARLNFSKMYLTNAVSGITLDGSIQRWANKMLFTNDCPSLTLETSPSPFAWQMGATDSLRFSRVFFALANPTEEDNLSTNWSPRFTRLVLEGSISQDGGDTLLEDVYYPIPIANLQANHRYIINRYTIIRPGLDSPGADARLLETDFSVTVKDWDETHTIYESL